MGGGGRSCANPRGGVGLRDAVTIPTTRRREIRGLSGRGSGRIGAGTHVGVELPHEAAEVCVREVLRHHVRGEPVHVVDGEVLAVVGPGDDIPVSLLLQEHVPAGCGRSGRKSGAKVGGMATGFAWGFVSFFLSPEDGSRDSHFAQEAGRQAEVPPPIDVRSHGSGCLRSEIRSRTGISTVARARTRRRRAPGTDFRGLIVCLLLNFSISEKKRDVPSAPNDDRDF